MTYRQRKPLMDDSWVVEQGDDSYGSDSRDEKSPPRRNGRQQRGSVDQTPEPEFRMPRVDVDESTEASWYDETKRSTRREKTPKSKEKTGARRRLPASNGSPEKRNRDKPTVTRSLLRNTQNPPVQHLTDIRGNTFQDLLQSVMTYSGMIFQWCLEVFGGALRVLKTPITYILALWLLFGAAVLVRNLITNSVYASLSPICRVPGASLLSLPFCPVHQVDKSYGAPPPVEFDQLMTVQSKFEEVLEESAGGVSLPMDMKRGEASIRDLRQLVRYSQLKSK